MPKHGWISHIIWGTSAYSLLTLSPIIFAQKYSAANQTITLDAPADTTQQQIQLDAPAATEINSKVNLDAPRQTLSAQPAAATQVAQLDAPADTRTMQKEEMTLEAPAETKPSPASPPQPAAPTPTTTVANPAPGQPDTRVMQGTVETLHIEAPIDTSGVRQSNVSQFYHAAPSETEQPAIGQPISATSTLSPATVVTQPMSAFDRVKSHLEFHGFSSSGIVRTNSPANYMIPDHGTIHNAWNFTARSLAGFQLTVNFGKSLALVGQVVANADGHHGYKSYQINAEWLYLRYKLNENSQISAGRFRLPAFLYSESQQVGYSYPWVFLPNEVYRIVPFQNYYGATAVYRIPLGKLAESTLSMQPYYGFNTSKYDLFTAGGITTPTGVVVPIPPGTSATFKENNLIGFVGTLGNQYFSIRGTFAHFALSANIPHFDPVNGKNFQFINNQSTTFYGLGGKVDYKHFLAISEFAHRSAPQQIASLTGFYVAGGYHIYQFLPLLTYAYITTTNRGALLQEQLFNFAELAAQQQSYTLSLAYYLNPHFAAKASISLIQPLNGTNGLFNSNPQKNNVLLYGVGIDGIF